MTDITKTRRGPKSVTENKYALAIALADIGYSMTNSEYVVTTSPFIQRQLAERGYIDFVKVSSSTRGRPRNVPVLTEDGLVTLATIKSEAFNNDIDLMEDDIDLMEDYVDHPSEWEHVNGW